MNFKGLFKRDKKEKSPVKANNEFYVVGTSKQTENATGIQGVKSRESLVMQEDPFGSAPFNYPVKSRDKSHKRLHSSARRRDIPEPVIEEKPEPLAYNYSPESRTNLLISSEGEAPLIATTETESDLDTSPPYVRVPLEDRSKYEKLVQGLDISSDSSDKEDKQRLQEKVKKKKKINIPEKLHHVYKTVELPIKSFRSDDKQAKFKKKRAQHPENTSEAVDIDSDDSIGSASDLKVDEDAVEVAQEAKEDMTSENISEDIKTCGSSAYHAECESMATHEEDCTSRIIRVKKKEEAKAAEQAQSEDMLFIGHQYGEKPLLMDDELDSDCDVGNTKWTPKKNDNESIWIPPSSSFEEPKDVFALAPFGKSRHRKISVGPEQPTFEAAVEESGLKFEERREEYPQYLSTADAPISLNPFLSPDFPSTVRVSSNFDNIEIASSQPAEFAHEMRFESNFGDNDPFFEKSPEESEKTIFETLSPSQNTSLLIDLSNSSTDNFPVLDPTSMFPIVSEPSNLRVVESPKMKVKKDKKKDKEMKSKYHLFDDSISDDSPSFIISKNVKITKTPGSSSKKSGKSKKSPPKIRLEEGFSNMSFEDFPSDERDTVINSELPFEVLRSPDRDGRKSNSKRISNPFS